MRIALPLVLFVAGLSGGSAEAADKSATTRSAFLGPSISIAALGARSPSHLHPDRQIELLAARIGRMILISFEGADPTATSPSQAAGMVREGRAGGVVLFSDNVRNPAELRRLTAALAAGSGDAPPFIAIDQEGGTIQRLTRAKGFRSLPSARSVGAMDLASACALYSGTAVELHALGINVNLGPVVDLDVNPSSPAIGRKARSYARDPVKVEAYARAFIAAHEAAGVLTVVKHFPGHGSAATDPHKQAVDITATWNASELEPFSALVAAHEADMIMVGHLVHPRFSDGNLPASLSRRTLTDELRLRLGFTGLIVTDDLRMGAIANRFAVEDAAVLAIGGGADLVIVAGRDASDSDVADRIVRAVTAAVVAGRIPAARIEGSYARIMAARTRLGAAAPPHSDPCATDAGRIAHGEALAGPAAD